MSAGSPCAKYRYRPLSHAGAYLSVRRASSCSLSGACPRPEDRGDDEGVSEPVLVAAATSSVDVASVGGTDARYQHMSLQRGGCPLCL